MKLIHAILCLSLVACGGGVGEDPSTTTEEQSESGPAEGMVRTELSGEDLPLVIDIPSDAGEPVVTWKEEFGHVEVTAGERFGLTITEIPGDMERKKADLSRDLLQTHEILSEENGTLIYKSTFPDSENLVFVHLYRVMEVDGRDFVIEDLASGQFKENDVRTMATAVKPAEQA